MRQHEDAIYTHKSTNTDAILFAVTSVLAVGIAFRIPVSLDLTTSNWLKVGVIYFLCVIPFLAGGIVVALTTATAFSPTDTMPLSSRTKVLMGLESSSALVLSLLVVSHAVGQLQ